MANLSSLRKFMDNFMQNLLQMGMSLSQARAQAKIWLDNQMQEYAKSLENQKTMEEIRNRNELGVLGERTKAATEAARVGFGYDVGKELAKTGFSGKGTLPILEGIKALDLLTPENRAAAGVQRPANIDQQLLEARNTGALGVDALQNLQNLTLEQRIALVRSIGIDNTIKLANDTSQAKLTTSQQGLTAAGQKIESAKLGLEQQKFALEQTGKPGQLTPVDKERIDQIDKAENYLISEQAGWDKWDLLNKKDQLRHPELKPLDAELLGTILQYSESIKNHILNGDPIEPDQIKFINIMKNPSAIKTGGPFQFTAPPSTAQPQVVAAPTVAEQPAVTTPQVSARDIYYNRLIENGVPPKDALNMTIAKFGK